uniref:Uncharacterized protein n=1 Tax=Meloidogyne enterolobii TaxID=390850 RepID=A0A6V7X6I4_MELEN|nr:unnamed protein product [Meloidogyne enterolobii]
MSGPQMLIRICRFAKVGPHMLIRKSRVRKCRSAYVGPQFRKCQYTHKSCHRIVL